MKLTTLCILSLLLTAAACTPGGGGVSYVQTGWSVDVDYRNAATGDALIGRQKYFTHHHLRIPEQTDTGYKDIFYYNELNATDEQKENFLVGLSQVRLTELDEKSTGVDVSEQAAANTLFDVTYIVRLSHARDTISDTLRLLKNTADHYEVIRNGVQALSAPSPTHPDHTPMLTVNKTVR